MHQYTDNNISLILLTFNAVTYQGAHFLIFFSYILIQNIEFQCFGFEVNEKIIKK